MSYEPNKKNRIQIEKECRAFLINKFNELTNTQIGSKLRLDMLFISDSYFVFDLQYVLHFRSNLKNGKAWRFALWLNLDEAYRPVDVTYIGEAVELMDKFKPSRTPISTKDMNEFLSMASLIVRHPKQAFVASLHDLPFSFPAYEEIVYQNPEEHFFIGYQAKYDIEKESYYRDESINKEDFINREWNSFWDSKRKRQQDKNKWLHYMQKTVPETIFKNIPYVSAVGIVDQNWKSDGWSTYPQYYIVVSIDISKYKKVSGKKRLKSIDKNERAEIQDTVLDVLSSYNDFLSETYKNDESGDCCSNDFEIDYADVCRSVDNLSRARYIFFRDGNPTFKSVLGRKRLIKKASITCAERTPTSAE